ncbi:hypothetical protein RHSIM_Rhsim01G0105500 [Rhododendron simsii]|uniref:K Homology domain-containing protein n=1 Tax=Rhododendron simsii TaxID=118357 RepID=A0A834HFK8_RHOSS|nr:hypothetical protein RHSIM_Rhsim01G0105500 [Rhododendron simsii]
MPLGAQEIAARIVNTAEAKRPRVDNNGVKVGVGVSIPKISTTVCSLFWNYSVFKSDMYRFRETSKKIYIASSSINVIIGKSGKTIKYLQLQSGDKIQVTRDLECDPYSPTRPVELMGTSDQIAKAEQLIQDVLAEAESGGSEIVSHRVTPGQPGNDRFLMQIPSKKILPAPYPEDTSKDRTLKIEGTSEQIEAAKELISEITRDSKWAPYSPTRPVELTGTSDQPDQVAKAKQLIKDVLAEAESRGSGLVSRRILGPYPGDTSEERTVKIEGTSEQIEAAKELVSEVRWIGPEGVRDGTTEWAIGSHASSVEPSHTREGTDVRCLLPLISEVPRNWREGDYMVTRFPDGSTSVRLGAQEEIRLCPRALFAQVLENMSLPGATPEDFDSARNGLEALTHFQLEVDWLRKRLEQMASLSELPVARDRLEKLYLHSDGIPSLGKNFYSSTIPIFLIVAAFFMQLSFANAEENGNTNARKVGMRRIKPSPLRPPMADQPKHQRPPPRNTTENGVSTTTGLPMP